MKVDPNRAVLMKTEYVLCEDDRIVLHDGQSVQRGSLEDGKNAFALLCRGLDPNQTFISAVLVDKRDMDVFLQAREVARAAGRHMQALVDTPENLRQQWERYVQSKQFATKEEG